MSMWTCKPETVLLKLLYGPESVYDNRPSAGITLCYEFFVVKCQAGHGNIQNVHLTLFFCGEHWSGWDDHVKFVME